MSKRNSSPRSTDQTPLPLTAITSENINFWVGIFGIPIIVFEFLVEIYPLYSFCTISMHSMNFNYSDVRIHDCFDWMPLSELKNHNLFNLLHLHISYLSRVNHKDRTSWQPTINIQWQKTMSEESAHYVLREFEITSRSVVLQRYSLWYEAIYP